MKTINKIVRLMDEMSVSELTELNRLVVTTIRMRQPELADAVRVGSIVEFEGRGGWPVNGKVIKRNPSKAVVKVGADQRWNVPYSMLVVVKK